MRCCGAQDRVWPAVPAQELPAVFVQGLWTIRFQERLLELLPMCTKSVRIDVYAFQTKQHRLSSSAQPALYVMYADIRRIEFDRQAGVTAKTFHMAVEMKNGITHTFSSIAAYVPGKAPAIVVLLLVVVGYFGHKYVVVIVWRSR